MAPSMRQNSQQEAGVAPYLPVGLAFQRHAILRQENSIPT